MKSRSGPRGVSRLGLAKALGGALLGLVLLTACTTVTPIDLASSTSGGSGPGARAAARGATGGTTTTVAAATGSTRPAGTGGAGSPGAPGAVATGAGSDAPAGTAKCTTPVKIGVSYSSDLAGGFASVGGSSGGASSAAAYEQQEQAVFGALAANLNSHGGLAGCPVELVYHDFLALAADGFSGESESECVDFAEDQHVFAVISTALENKTLISCLAQHGVVSLFDSEEYAATAQDFSTYKAYLYEPDAINIDRWGPYIKLLSTIGFLGSGAKVGILVGDDGSGNGEDLVNNVWVPALKALGFTPVVFTYTSIEGYSDVTNATDQFNAAVLQFKAAGVNRIIVSPDGGNTTVFFTQLAASQGFDPEYAMNDLSAMDEWSTVPASQQPGAVAISYNLTDSASTTGPQPPASSARSSCGSLLGTKAGSAGVYSYYAFCDDFAFLGAAVLAGAPAVTPATLLAGAEKLGCTLPLASLYTNACFGPGKYDGATSVQALRWSGNNWVNVGSPVTVP